MFQSTFGEQPVAVHWYVVYDSRNGNVLHTHQFIDMDKDVYTAETEAGNDRGRMALQAAEQHGDATHLRVIQAPAGFQFELGMTCRVDVATGELVTDPHHSRREFKERIRAGTERKSRPRQPRKKKVRSSGARSRKKRDDK
jgi:hypothetical protein